MAGSPPVRAARSFQRSASRRRKDNEQVRQTGRNRVSALTGKGADAETVLAQLDRDLPRVEDPATDDAAPKAPVTGSSAKPLQYLLTPLQNVRPARRTFQDYWPLRPWCFVAEFRYQPRVSEQIRKSHRSRFFRPLLYRLSYLGGILTLLGNSRTNRTSGRPMV